MGSPKKTNPQITKGRLETRGLRPEGKRPEAKPQASSLKSQASLAVPLAGFQREWITDRARFKIACKARRIGFTFATTLEIALDLISRRTRWLIISRTQDAAKEALKEVRNHFIAMKKLEAAAEIREEPTELFFEGLRVSKFVIEMPNGSEISAMTAHPDAARGFGGNVFLDEHGFHRDSKELWKGAAAAVTRGHRLLVVSTPHYQAGNYFELARKAGLIHRRGAESAKKNTEEISADSSAASASLRWDAGIWSAHWVDIHTAAPQLRQIGVPIDLDELRELAGDDEAWQQEYGCQFLSAAEMWIPLELIAAARSPQARLDWDPEAGETPALPGQGWLYVGFDIGRKRDRTVIWIDERVGEIAIARGVITLDRATFEQQFQVLTEIIAHPRVRRACGDQTGIGMALVERLRERHGYKVEGVTFTAETKEQMSLLVRRRFEERLDKIPEDAPPIERAIAAVKRQATASGNLRFDAARTDAGHADEYWAKALADFAAESGIAAVSLGADPPGLRIADFGLRIVIPSEARDRSSVWDPATPEKMEIFG